MFNKRYFYMLIGIIFLLIFMHEIRADTISACPTVISSGGYYELTASISGATNCINVTASNVDINCNGFAIVYGTAGMQEQEASE